MSATIKVVQEYGIPTTQIMFTDGLVGASLMVCIAAARKELKGLLTINPLQVVLMIVNVAAAFLLFHSYAHLPLVTAYVIAYLAPFFIVMLSAIFLKEKVSKAQLAGICAGFIGVIVALSPQQMAVNAA